MLCACVGAAREGRRHGGPRRRREKGNGGERLAALCFILSQGVKVRESGLTLHAKPRAKTEQISQVDPETLYTLLERIGKGSFGVVHKGYACLA